MRGLACCVVVAYHVFVEEEWRGRTVWAHLPHLLLSNSTNLFVFIAGFLVQHLSADFHYRRFLSTRFSTVFLPYAAVSTPLILRQYWRHSGLFASRTGAAQILTALQLYLTGSHMPVPFWFMPVIMVFFLATPLLLVVVRQDGLAWLFAGTLAVAIAIHRPEGHYFGLQGLLYFLPAYLAGMAVGLHREAVLSWVGRNRHWLLIGIVGLVVTNAWTQDKWGPLYSRAPFSREAGLLDLDLPARLMATVLMLEIFRRYETLTWKWFKPTADVSFGVFLLHEPVLQLLDGGHWMSRLHTWPMRVGAIPIVSGGVILVCMAILRSTRRVFGRWSRYLVGY
jgi:peptidoglycan/LPS O-acetylase OafA/YrhL